jgi:cation diffusion facilitator family transporter
MLAETAHSVADTGNEVLLFVGLRRSRRSPDDQRPFGYGQERYFWSFLAALGIFLIGGTLSIGEGLRSILLPEPLESPWVGVGVLVVSAALEGYSWNTARRQLRRGAQASRRSLLQHLQRASDPSPTTVYLEDSAALIGLSIALVGLVLHAATGWAGWDAIGSMCIGVLLIVVAFLLAGRSKSLLVDETAPPDLVEPIRAKVAGLDWVGDVPRIQAIFVGPLQLLVNVGVTVAAAHDQRPAHELVRQVSDLRTVLLDTPLVAEATVTLVER